MFHGFKIAREAPSISHVFFANDSLFFFKTKSEECTDQKTVATI